jgi:hypothetical protein
MKTTPLNSSEKMLAELFKRLDRFEKLLSKNPQPEFDWYEASEICKRFGISQRSLDCSHNQQDQD